MKFLFKLIKRFIFSSFLLYCFNYIAISFNMVIPFNFYTLLLIFAFGPFSLIGLSLFRLLL